MATTTPVPSATQWGSLGASKRALLIHGNTSSSHTWETVGQDLARAGFLVIAPNLLGHGNRPAEDFHLQTFAEDLHSSYFANGLTYDVIIGHSLGGTIVLSLLPLLSAQNSRKAAVILIDPAITFRDGVLDDFAIRCGKEIARPRTVEAYMSEEPTWTRQAAVSTLVAYLMAQSELPTRIFDHIKPFEYGHLFDAIPPHVNVSVLLSDPELGAICSPEMVPAHPQVRAVMTVKGSGHWIQNENPGVIVKTAVDEVERLA